MLYEVITGDEAAERALLSEILALGDLTGPAADIFRVIDRGSGEVRDLSELRAIRQGITRIRADIERLVGTYLSDDSIRPMLQSTLPALRDGLVGEPILLTSQKSYRFGAARPWFYKNVITSYSIHYTKLYESSVSI